MTAEDWQRIKDVAASALELAAEDRATYIAHACGGDRALELEVRALLESIERASPLFEDGLLATPEGLASGERLGPYEIVRFIDAGGMGEVYHARDARLGRDVAIKVLPIAFAAHPDRVRRFEQEARSAGILNHPNIVTIYDIGTYGGAPYVVAEFLEGQTLRQRMSGPLSADDAVRFATQVAEGLAAAHEKGIVHRDLKPENLFVTKEERIKILDFGLAKLVDGARDVPGDATMPGMVLGTVGYMSPEQVRGGRIDHRSDLFALGAILYEMLSGARAFTGGSAVETMNAIVAFEPAPLSSIRSGTPEALARVVEHALQKDPERRIQTAKAFAAELRTAAEAVPARPTRRWFQSAGRRRAAAAAALVVTVAAAVYLGRRVLSPPVAQRDTVVVGDIVNKTGDAVFDGTLKEALLLQLEPSPFLSILPESSLHRTMQMMGRTPDERLTPDVAREVCQREGAKATLTGSISALGSRYVIDLNAADCVSGDAFAREHEETDRKEAVVEALGRATARLRGKLGESLASIQRFDAPVERATTSSLEALKNFSLAVLARARGADAQAIALLNRAIELDPGFPVAHSRLSAIYSVAGEFELAAQNARLAYENRAKTGERERLAIEHGYYKRATGEIRRAIATLEAWKQLYPRDFDPPLQLSSIHSQTGEYQTAADEAREAIRLGAPAAQSAAALGRAYLGLNQFDELTKLSATMGPKNVAQQSLQYGVEYIGGNDANLERMVGTFKGSLGEPYVRVWHAHGAMARGRLAEAREQFRLTEESAERLGFREVAATVVAMEAVGEAALGNQEQARRRAEASVKAFFGRQSTSLAAMAFALANAADEAAALEKRLAAAYPTDTLVTEVFLPSVRALIASGRGATQEGLEILRRAIPYELGWTSYYLPPYCRGLIYLQAHDGPNARGQFQTILDHQGVMPVSPLYSLAHLHLARAAALSGDAASAKQEYERFLTIWRDADPGVPLAAQARAEYEELLRLPQS